MDVHANQPIKLALIATYPEMSKIFLHMAEKKGGIVAYDEYASFNDAITVAQKLEPNVDAILSRGGTAEYIKNNVSIPVIFIPITPFDVVMAMQKIDLNVKEVALSHFSKRIFGVEEIERICGVKIHEYIFDDRDDIEKNILDAKKRGIKVVIGGEVAVSFAHKNGLLGYDLSAGNDTVNRAVDEAVSIVRTARQERDRATRLAAALNSITEGLVITDENSNVLICNPSALKMLGDNCAIGKAYVAPCPDIDLKKAANAPQFNRMRKIGDIMVNTNLIPVILGERFIGIVHTFEDVTKIQQLEQDIRNQLHDKGFVARYRFEDIATNDHQMQALKKRAVLYAKTDTTIMIEGESGTGKELFAQSIHNASARVDGPFIAINCAAIPQSLLESELFGYEAGAFTGAKKEGRRGLFELAHRGTMFLDEIGDIPKLLQTRLLRVLQEKELMRVGGTRVVPIDTRIISATNKNLRKLVSKGDFRDDLYYRLSVFQLSLPPLRERRGDVEMLCRIFLAQMKMDVDEKQFRYLLPSLLAYHWPGNVRELRNVTERLSLLLPHASRETLRDSIDELGLYYEHQGKGLILNIDVSNGLRPAIEQAEHDIIDHLLRLNNNNHNLTAKALRIGRSTLWRKYTQQDSERDESLSQG
ncbi:MAG: sigma 54-interacting transcriptional regulator [Planctomycetes bacterium]|nr:sigma 54-interacting transcriptional regulator [Planctomycetota bacterium]